MKIIKYNVSKATDGGVNYIYSGSSSGSSSSVDVSELQNQIDSLKEQINTLNKYFQLVNGVVVCKYPLASVDDITAYNIIQQ